MGSKRPSPTTKPNKNSKKSKDTQKSSKTDTKNRFRFKTFNERIESVDIHSFRRLSGFHYSPDQPSTFSHLQSAVAAWQDLNYTTVITDLLQNLSSCTHSLASILFFHQDIAKFLLEAFECSRDRQGVLPAICNLTAMFVQDLGGEAYAHFDGLFRASAKALSDAKEAADVEAAFSCLVYLVKTMKCELLGDVQRVASVVFSPLLQSAKKQYLRKLACYTVSYLVRQQDDMQVVSALISCMTDTNAVLIENVAECILLSAIDVETRKPKSNFAGIFKACLKSGNSQFVSVLCKKAAERLSDFGDFLSALEVALLDDETIKCVLASAKGRLTDSFIMSLKNRFISNGFLLAAALQNSRLDSVITLRPAFLSVICQLPDQCFCDCLAVLIASQWPHIHVIFSLTDRSLTPQLITTFAILKKSGLKFDWSKLNVPVPTSVAGAYLNGQVEHSAIPDSVEGQVVLASLHCSDHELVHKYLMHPTVIISNAAVLSSSQLHLALSSEIRLVSSAALNAYGHPGKLMNLLVKLDNVPITLESFRERILLLKQLEFSVSSEADAKLAISYLLGAVHVKLTVLWPETFKVLSNVSSKYPQVFDDMFNQVYQYCCSPDRQAEVYDNIYSTPQKDSMYSFIQQMNGDFDRWFYSKMLISKSYSLLSPTNAIPIFLRMAASQPTLANLMARQLSELLSLTLSADAPNDERSNLLCGNASLVRAAKSGLIDCLRAAKSVSLMPPMSHEIALKYLANGDDRLQSSALGFIIAAKRIPPEFAQKLSSFFDGRAFRDELILLSTDIGQWTASSQWTDVLCPVLVRLLYGRMISRKGAKSGRGSMSDRRKTILGAMNEDSLRNAFVDYLVGLKHDADPGKILGMLGMLDAVFSCMGRSLTCQGYQALVGALLDIYEMSNEDNKRIRQSTISRTRMALEKCPPAVSMDSLLQRAWGLMVEPRIAKFEHELVQSKSSIIEIISLVSLSPQHHHLVSDCLLQKLSRSISSEHIKEDLIPPFMQIIHNIYTHTTHLSIPGLIEAISSRTISAAQLRRPSQPQKQIFWSGVKLMQLMACRGVTDGCAANELILMAVNVLDSASRLHESFRCELIVLIERLLPIASSVNVHAVNQALSRQFCAVKERRSAQALVQAFYQLHAHDAHVPADLISDLLAWSPDALDEPDYDRRFDGLSRLRHSCGQFSAMQWTPTLHILLSVMANPQEAALKSQSMEMIERCVEQEHELSMAVIIPAIQRNVMHQSEEVRVEFMRMLGFMVEHRCEKQFDVLKPLLGSSQESNFFANIGHLQVHRRARAIRQLPEWLAGKTDAHDLTFLTDIVCPFLLKYCIYDDATPPPLVTMESVRTVGWIVGGCMEAGRIVSKVKYLVRLIKKPQGSEKQAVKLLPEIIRNCRIGEDHLSVLMALLFDAMAGGSTAADSRKPADRSTVKHISIASAIASLLVQQPVETKRLYLPKLLTALSMSCRSRLEDERRAGRDTLVKIYRLFPEFLHDIVSELALTLTRGYQVHVLSYCVHQLVSVHTDADLSAYARMVPILIRDCLGEPAIEKMTEEWSGKIVEVRESKSIAALQALMSKCPLTHVLPLIVDPLVAAASTVRHKLIAGNVKLVHDAVYMGLASNEQGDVQSKLVICHELMSRPGPLAIGMRYLLSVLKHDKHTDQMSMFVDPLIKLIDLNCTDGLKLMAFIIAHPHVYTQVDMHLLVQQAFSIITRSSTATHSELIAHAFKLIAAIIHHRPDAPLTEGQVKALLQYTAAHMDRLEGQQTTFSLIKAVLHGRIVSVEVYDLVGGKLMESMVTGSMEQTRRQCLECVLFWLREYPLSDARRQQVVAFCLANLAYGGEGGREGALLAIQALARMSLLADHDVSALVMRCTDEESERVRAVAKDTLGVVVQHLSAKALARAVSSGQRWCTSDKLSVQRAAWCLCDALHSARCSLLDAACVSSAVRVLRLFGQDDSDDLANYIVTVCRVLVAGKDCFVGVDGLATALQAFVHFPNVVVRSELICLFTELHDLALPAGDLTAKVCKCLSELQDVHGVDAGETIVKYLCKQPEHDQVVHRLEKTVRRAGQSQFAVQIGSALKYFGAVVHTRPCLSDAVVAAILKCCQRVITDQSLVYPDELKGLARQVQQAVQDKCAGFDVLLNGVSRERADRKKERVVAAKRRAVTDPAARARECMRREECKST